MATDRWLTPRKPGDLIPRAGAPVTRPTVHGPGADDEPRSTDLPITSTDVEHRFWTEQLEPSGQPRTSELLEEVPSFSYKDRVVSVSRKDLEALDNYIDLYGQSEGRSSLPPPRSPTYRK